MKVGDYVRTKKGEIGKIIDYINEPTDYYFNCYATDLKKTFGNKYITEYDNEINSSPDIIDLIEVGDYVNGYLVLNVLEFNDNSKMISLEKIYDNKIAEEDIKLIVTKEQFENCMYKVGELDER